MTGRLIMMSKCRRQTVKQKIFGTRKNPNLSSFLLFAFEVQMNRLGGRSAEFKLPSSNVTPSGRYFIPSIIPPQKHFDSK